MFIEMLEKVKATTPLVHCITNYVTVNDVANMLLASGGAPIMADAIEEVEDITSICGSLVLNIGTLNTRTIASMVKAGEKAVSLGHPVILDPVGAGASPLRTETTFTLLEKIRFSVIRGNISEIMTIAKGSGTTRGVDADLRDMVTEDNLDEAVSFAKDLSAKTGAVIAITGAIDIVADGKKAYIIRNGHPMMGRITGTGCMLTALIGAYVCANPDQALEATAAAVCLMGLAGELAHGKTVLQDGGTSSFRMHLIDAVSTMDGETLEEGATYEVR
jgi:hydroxyethylthiazole kinase